MLKLILVMNNETGDGAGRREPRGRRRDRSQQAARGRYAPAGRRHQGDPAH